MIVDLDVVLNQGMYQVKYIYLLYITFKLICHSICLNFHMYV